MLIFFQNFIFYHELYIYNLLNNYKNDSQDYFGKRTFEIHIHSL